MCCTVVVGSYGNNHDNNRDTLSRLVNGKDLHILTARSLRGHCTVLKITVSNR